MSDPRDPLDFLDTQPAAPPDLREALWQNTARLLRRKLWRRRLQTAAALAACVLAGMGIMWLLQPRPKPEIIVQRIEVPQKPFAEEKPQPTRETAVALEWRAFDSSENRGALYFQAGHRYLDDHGDMQSALRCYRLAFETDPELAQITDPGDNWLVVALKNARRKEISHASPLH
ncbi:MAG: hypothetical protein L0215_23335 [Gemmataceae bacterium]|nr:hypothetical protein [Gemmataceae bacterium]